MGMPASSATTSPDRRYSAITRAASAPVVARRTVGTSSASCNALTRPLWHTRRSGMEARARPSTRPESASGMQELSLFDQPSDPGGDLGRRLVMVGDDVPRRDAGATHLPPHVFRSLAIGEAVPLPRADALQAYLEGREQQDVVQPSDARGSTEGLQEPRPHDTVVDHMAVPGQTTGRGSRALYPRSVLRLR